MYGKLGDVLTQELESIREQGLFKEERVLESPQGAEVTVGGATVLNFCANNYLGLASDPRVVEAARRTLAEMTPRFGDDVSSWRWGDYHTVTFFHAVFPGETAARWLGGGIHPMPGSAESLNRGLAKFDDPENTSIIASLRMVIDLADDDKIAAHFPGGNSERLFSPWNTSQLPAWLSGEKLYWWFSDKEIDKHIKDTLVLNP